jgi:hypothetical protein
MKRPAPPVLLHELRQLLRPEIRLEEVAQWVASGRERPRLYWRVWLRRVWRWPLN